MTSRGVPFPLPLPPFPPSAAEGDDDDDDAEEASAAKYAARSSGLTAVPVIHGSDAVVKMAMRRPGSRREEEVALRRLAASLCKGPSPGRGRTKGWAVEEGEGEEESLFAEVERGGRGAEEREGREQGQERCCCCCLLFLPASAAEAAAEEDDDDDDGDDDDDDGGAPLSPRSALAAAASGAGRSASSLSPAAPPSAASLLLTISVIIDDVGHAKLASEEKEEEVPEALAAALAACLWTCDAVLCADRASAAPSWLQFPATVSAVSSRVRAAARAALCREAWAAFRAASSSRACFFLFFLFFFGLVG